LAATVCVVWWCVGASPSFQECEHTRKNAYTHHSPHQSHPIVGSFIVRTISRVQLHTVCVGAFVDENQGPITALSGVLVALFTATLWFTTKQLWQSAEAQRASDKIARLEDAERLERSLKASESNAAAILGVELPRLEISNAYISKRISATSIVNSDIIDIVFKNYGRTAAHIVEDCTVPIAGDFLPEPAEYPAFRKSGALLGTIATDERVYRISCKLRASLTEDEIRKIASGECGFWIYGYVAYRDFLNVYWCSKFCLKCKTSERGIAYEESNIYPSYNGRYRYDQSTARSVMPEGNRLL
jgi:hypothetical protein